MKSVPLTALATAATRILDAPLWVWGMVAPVGTLFLSLLIFHFFRRLSSSHRQTHIRIKDVGTQSPGITVAVRDKLGTWFLDVTNTGHSPDSYQGQIHITSVENGRTIRDVYTAVWSDGRLSRDVWETGRAEVTILPGLRKSIALAELQVEAHSGLITPTLFSFSPILSDNGIQRINAGTWMPSPNALKPRIHFDVVVSSNPSNQGGPYRDSFSVGVDGLQWRRGENKVDGAHDKDSELARIEFCADDVVEEIPRDELTPLFGSNRATNRRFHVRVIAAIPLQSISLRVTEINPPTRSLSPVIPFELPLATGEVVGARISLDAGVVTRFALAQANSGDTVADLIFYRRGSDPISIVTSQERLSPLFAPFISRQAKIRLAMWANGQQIAGCWIQFTWGLDEEDRELRASML